MLNINASSLIVSYFFAGCLLLTSSPPSGMALVNGPWSIVHLVHLFINSWFQKANRKLILRLRRGAPDKNHLIPLYMSSAAHLETTTVETAKQLGLLPEEFEKIKQVLGRVPNFNELSIYSVMWSEHCSYKNSIKWLKTLPRKGKNLLVESR